MATSADRTFHRGVGWVCAAFFGIGLLVLLRRLLFESREIKVSAAGVSDSNWKLGTIPWSEVAEVWVATIKRMRFVCFSLRRPHLFIGQLGPAKRTLVAINRALGFGDLQLAAVGLKVPAEELVREISKYVPVRSA